jgi:hypothetical protein
MLKRLKNKFFLLALASFIYQILAKLNIAPDAGLYQLGIDLLTFAFLGAGIYSTFDKEGEK